MRTFKETPDALPFSRELVPLLLHPLVDERDETHRFLLAQKLYSYLMFTEHLERKVIIPACVNLAHGEVPFHTPRSLHRDASKIVVDEAHHAECAGDLMDQMVAATRVQALATGEPAFLHELRKEESERGDSDRNLVRMTFAAVSETLITGTLTRVPADRCVNASIREVIMDHAIDEAKHHACFSNVIRIMWEGITDMQKRTIGPLFAKFICDFLAPDILAELDWLEGCGFSASEARRIIEEVYALDRTAIIREDAAPTVLLMKRYGILEHSATEDAFAEHGLL